VSCAHVGAFWGAAAIKRAQAVSRLARQTGCGVDEAADLGVGQFTKFNGIQGQRAGNLHFAGEQTSVNYQGYIEGGLRSGYRCATEVGG
jgi:monoamine oxidase